MLQRKVTYLVLFIVIAGVPVAFKTWRGHQYMVGILCPPGYNRVKIKAKTWWGPVWQYGLWSFQTGGTKIKRFLPKNQHTQGKLLNFENWFNRGGVKKVPKI